MAWRVAPLVEVAAGRKVMVIMMFNNVEGRKLKTLGG